MYSWREGVKTHNFPPGQAGNMNAEVQGKAGRDEVECRRPGFWFSMMFI